MLTIVPFIVQHPGTDLREVSRLFGVPAEALRKDLDLLFLSGLPPYGPGDLIDVEVDEDDRVWIRMADHFARPLRLTRHEARSLALRATELLATPGFPEAPALRSALAKLRAGLGADEVGAGDAIEAAEGGRPAPHLDLLREAARERRRLEIEYYSASSGEWSARTIEPEEVFSSLGHWYVAAWDVTHDAERLFRADRVRSASPTGETFEPRGLEGAGRDLYTPSEDDVAVRLLLRPGARWVAEYYAVTDAVERDDGALEVTLPAKRLGWVAGLLLRLGGDAEALDPQELRDRVRDLAVEALVRYG
jgi:proteasome accessory factor C